MIRRILISVCFILLLITGCTSNLKTSLLSDFEEWIEDIDASMVSEISVESGYIGVAPGSPTTIDITTDPLEIERLVDYLKTLELSRDRKEIVSGGSFRTITVTTVDSSHTVRFNNSCYFAKRNDNYFKYKIDELPSISEDKIARTEYGMV